ncbi:MAG: methyltransferase [Pseudohongiella sp.]|nr:methyltransferase [Pseudohongiella sp.]MDO9521076.1 methyltransferase [Pseudohongiella sp.]MDP2129013.1 methyltransferase [Pseudohongiella sp.]
MKDHCQALVLEILTTASEGKTLWVMDENPPIDELLKLNGTQSIEVISNRYDTSNQMGQLGIKTLLSDFDFSELPQYQRIVYRISKEKMLTHHVINQALRHLTDDGVFFMIGEKTDGMKSITRQAAEVYEQDVSARKFGNAYLGQFVRPQQSLLDQKSLPTANYTELRLIRNPVINFYSKPGVFGWEKVDKGSQLLVSCLPPVIQYMKGVESVLDLGCGWGYLMLATKDIDIPVRVATDNNVPAIDAAKKNFSEAGLKVDCVLDDCGSQIKQRFDLILCNPPFHQGFQISDALTDKFLKSATRMSRRSTRVIFVVNQFIPLQKLAEAYFKESRLLAASDGFNVFELRP